MEAIAAMIGSAAAESAALEEKEIQIVEIFNQDVAKSGLGPFRSQRRRRQRREHNKFISSEPVSFLTSLKKCVASKVMGVRGHGHLISHQCLCQASC